jgi:hypothetical protein
MRGGGVEPKRTCKFAMEQQREKEREREGGGGERELGRCVDDSVTAYSGTMH